MTALGPHHAPTAPRSAPALGPMSMPVAQDTAAADHVKSVSGGRSR